MFKIKYIILLFVAYISITYSQQSKIDSLATYTSILDKFLERQSFSEDFNGKSLISNLFANDEVNTGLINQHLSRIEGVVSKQKASLSLITGNIEYQQLCNQASGRLANGKTVKNGDVLIVKAKTDDDFQYNRNGEIYLSKCVRCIFPSGNDFSQLKVNEIIYITGKITHIAAGFIILENCKLLREAEFTVQEVERTESIKTYLTYLKGYANSKMPELLTIAAESEFQQSNWKKAKEYLEKIYELTNDNSLKINVDNQDPEQKKIKSLQDAVKYCTTKQLYDSVISLREAGKYDEAFSILMSNFIGKPFYNTQELIRETARNNFDAAWLIAKKEADLPKMIEIYAETKLKISKAFPDLYDSLKQKTNDDFVSEVKKRYSYKLSGAKLIPGGDFFKSGSGETIEITNIFINKQEIDLTLVKAFDIIFGSNIEKTVDLRLADSNLEVFQDSLKQWLDITFLTPYEKEYIECDGFRSIKERDMLKQYNRNYSAVDLNKLHLYYKPSGTTLTSEQKKELNNKCEQILNLYSAKVETLTNTIKYPDSDYQNWIYVSPYFQGNWFAYSLGLKNEYLTNPQAPSSLQFKIPKGNLLTYSKIISFGYSFGGEIFVRTNKDALAKFAGIKFEIFKNKYDNADDIDDRKSLSKTYLVSKNMEMTGFNIFAFYDVAGGFRLITGFGSVEHNLSLDVTNTAGTKIYGTPSPYYAKNSKIYLGLGLGISAIFRVDFLANYDISVDSQMLEVPSEKPINIGVTASLNVPIGFLKITNKYF